MEVVKSWLQEYFDKELPSDEALVDAFNTYAFEVEGLRKEGADSIIDVDVLPNRSSDCLSHRGVAKELGTILGLTLKDDPFRRPIPNWGKPEKLTVTVDDALLTPRYMAAVVHGVKVGPSPEWLANALKKLGQKSVNNIVDATNYVMFNLGQPIHAFDMNKLAVDETGVANIRVRLAEKGEQITTLTGDEYTLSETHQLITDGIDGTPLALAGIKGGKHAEVDAGTTDIVVEVANFNAFIVRKASNELKLQTDASLRFQNNLVPHLTAIAMRDVIQLIEDIASGKEAGVCDAYAGYTENEPLLVSMEKIRTLLGIPLTEKEVEDILQRLEWEFSKDRESFTVTGPWERTDISIKEDVIEEIGRIYGYKNIVSEMPKAPDTNSAKVNKTLYYTELIQQSCIDLGYSEVLTYTIVDSGEVELENPFASDKSFMRRELKNGIDGALTLNVQHAPMLGLQTVQLFEVGTVFTNKGERLHFALGARSSSIKQSKIDTKLKEDMTQVLKTLGHDTKEVAVENGIVEVDLDSIFPLLPTPQRYNTSLPWNTHARYSRWSTFPFVLRDIAVWVPQETDAEEVQAIITAHSGDLLVRCDLFDTFQKEGKVSYAWHLVFQSPDKTLTDESVNAIMEVVSTKIHEHSGWEVR